MRKSKRYRETIGIAPVAPGPGRSSDSVRSAIHGLFIGGVPEGPLLGSNLIQATRERTNVPLVSPLGGIPRRRLRAQTFDVSGQRFKEVKKHARGR